MQQYGRIAYRYADSILQLATERNVVDEVAADMGNLLVLLSGSRDLKLMLASPIVPHFTKLSILKSIFEGKYNALTVSLFEILASKKREGALPEIAKSFVAQYELKKGIQRVYVITAVALSENNRAQLTQLAKDFTGKEIILIETVDSTVIGGFRMNIGDRQIDETISAKLAELKLKLIDQSYIAKL